MPVRLVTYSTMPKTMEGYKKFSETLNPAEHYIACMIFASVVSSTGPVIGKRWAI